MIERALAEKASVDARLRDAGLEPDCYLQTLDASQLAAVRLALTRELAIVQGPPGTGKTFVGLKVMRMLLDNVCGRLVHTPILVICFTNHALDQVRERGERESESNRTRRLRSQL